MPRRNSTLGRSVLDLDIDDSAFHSKLSGAYKAANQFTAQAGSSLMRAGKAISGVGDSMIRNITLPIVAAGGAVAHFALEFDTTMRRIVGLAKVPEAAIAGVRDSIEKMATEVGRSPQELGEAFYFVASAGFKADEAMQVLEISAKAAAAGMGQTQDIAKVLGGVINAYGHENITAARAGDILTAAIQDGAAEASDFASVIGFVVPVAASLGVSFDQVTAALAAMTQVGISAETAATNLGQVMAALQKPTAQAEAAMEGLGLSSAGLRQELNEKGLLATLRTLEERFGGDEVAAAAVFGNIRALRGVTALLSLDTEQLNGIFADTAGALNTLQDAYDATDGPQRRIDQAMARLNVSAIELGSDVLPVVVEVLGKVADAASGVADWWEGLDQGTRDLIVSMLAWLAITGPVLLIVGKLASGLGGLLKVVTFLGGANGIPRLLGAVKLMGPATLGWVGAIAVGAAALNAATPAVSDFFDELFAGKKANKVLHELNDLTGDMLKAQVLRAWGVSAKQFAKVVEKAGGDVNDAFDAIKDNAHDVGKALSKLSVEGEPSSLFPGWGTRDPTKIAEALDAGRKKAQEFPDGVAAALVDGQFEVERAAEVMVDPIADALEKAKQDVADAANDLLHTLATTLSSHPQELLDAAKAMWDDILHPFPDIKHRLTLEGLLAAKWLITGLTSSDSGDRARTAEYIKGLLAEYEQLAPGALAAGDLVNPALQAGIDRTLNALTTYLNDTVVGGIKDQFDLADELERMGYPALAGYVRGLETARLQELNHELLLANQDIHTGLPSELYEEGHAAGVSYSDGMLDGLNTSTRRVMSYAGKIANILKFAGSPAYTHSREAGEGVGLSYMHELIAAIAGMEPALAKVLPNLGPDIAMPRMPAVAALGMSGGAAPTASGGSGPTTIEYNWNLTVGGVPYEFKTRDDFIKALDAVARFGGMDGRLAASG